MVSSLSEAKCFQEILFKHYRLPLRTWACNLVFGQEYAQEEQNQYYKLQLITF